MTKQTKQTKQQPNFDEAQAKELIEKHGLSKATLRAWKLRGAIPKAYLDPDYQRPTSLKEGKQLELQGLIVEFLTTQPVVVKRLVGESHYQQFLDVRAGDYKYSKEELARIVGVLSDLYKETKKVSKTRGNTVEKKEENYISSVRAFGMLPYIVVVGHEVGLVVAKTNTLTANRAANFFSKRWKPTPHPNNLPTEVVNASYEVVAHMRASLKDILDFAKVHLK